MTGSVSDVDRTLLERAAAAPMLAQVESWAGTNSGSANLAGLEHLATQLADAFSTLPGDVALHEAAPVEAVTADGETVPLAHGRNLHVRVRPAAPVQILLTGHMDTVFAADNPFQGLTWLGEGVLNGPGVADMKGGLAIMLAALTAFEGTDDARRLGYEVVVNSDEEVGSPGSAPLIAAAARGKLAALTYEPSLAPDGTLASARPGSGNFSIVIAGKDAHAGRNPQDGRNAVVAAADLTLRLSRIAGPGLTVNPARIDGGGPNNVVPAHAVLRVNMRPSLPQDAARARLEMEEVVAMVAAAHDVAVHVHGGFGRPPKPFDARTERLFGLVRDCGARMGLEIGWRPTGGVCDGNNIAATGVPVVDTLGARGGAIHSADEYLLTDSLAERAGLSALVLTRLARGEGL